MNWRTVAEKTHVLILQISIYKKGRSRAAKRDGMVLKGISFYHMQNMQERRAGEGAATVRYSGDSAEVGNLKIKQNADLGFVIHIAVPKVATKTPNKNLAIALPLKEEFSGGIVDIRGGFKKQLKNLAIAHPLHPGNLEEV